MKHIHEIAHAAATNGTPFNLQVVARRPLGEEIVFGKRQLTLQFAHLGEALKRAGHPYVAIIVYERKRGSHLHGHMLLYASRAGKRIIDRYEEGDTVKINRAHKNSVRYLTKQRQQLPPEYERDVRGLAWTRQPGDYIPGPRLTASADAKALVAHLPWPKRRTTSPPPAVAAKPEPAKATPVPVQLTLGIALPRIDLFALAEAMRIAAGLSQRQAAIRIGIKQPQWSNAIVRRHDTLSPWVWNRVREFIDDAKRAA